MSDEYVADQSNYANGDQGYQNFEEPQRSHREGMQHNHHHHNQEGDNSNFQPPPQDFESGDAPGVIEGGAEQFEGRNEEHHKHRERKDNEKHRFGESGNQNKII